MLLWWWRRWFIFIIVNGEKKFDNGWIHWIIYILKLNSFSGFFLLLIQQSKMWIKNEMKEYSGKKMDFATLWKCNPFWFDLIWFDSIRFFLVQFIFFTSWWFWINQISFFFSLFLSKFIYFTNDSWIIFIFITRIQNISRLNVNTKKKFWKSIANEYYYYLFEFELFVFFS